jgi:hypothetical protein
MFAIIVVFEFPPSESYKAEIEHKQNFYDKWPLTQICIQFLFLIHNISLAVAVNLQPKKFYCLNFAYYLEEERQFWISVGNVVWFFVWHSNEVRNDKSARM